MALINSSDSTPKATPLEAGDPVPAAAVTQQGSTFAERAAAAKKAEKAVKPDDAEDKAVAKSESKARSTRKKA